MGFEPMSAPAIRVRFAPSPTGYLHIGGGRTALFNWLYVKKYGGTFILRIEDTDKERSTDDNTKSILEGLKWLGLDWDEGPFLQSDGVERHKQVAAELLAAGKAYRSFATAAEMEAQRKQADAEKRPWQRDAPSRLLSKEESDARAAKGEPFTVRFRVPEGDGATVFEDGVYGTQERKHKDTEDFALLRPDGSPLYNFVVVCDDIHMVIIARDSRSGPSVEHPQADPAVRGPRQEAARIRPPAADQRARPGEVVQAQTRRSRFRDDLPRQGLHPRGVPQLPGPDRLVVRNRQGVLHHPRADRGVLPERRFRAATRS